MPLQPVSLSPKGRKNIKWLYIVIIVWMVFVTAMSLGTEKEDEEYSEKIPFAFEEMLSDLDDRDIIIARNQKRDHGYYIIVVSQNFYGKRKLKFQRGSAVFTWSYDRIFQLLQKEAKSGQTWDLIPSSDLPRISQELPL